MTAEFTTRTTGVTRAVLALLAVSIMCAVALTYMVEQASASAATNAGCQSTNACGWKNTNQTGGTTPSSRMQKSSSTYNFQNASGPCNGNWNDCISAVANAGTSGLSTRWWWNSNCGGSHYSVTSGAYIGSIGGHGDQFSSLDWGGGPAC